MVRGRSLRAGADVEGLVRAEHLIDAEVPAMGILVRRAVEYVVIASRNQSAPTAGNQESAVPPDRYAMRE